jgi:hypothetical protein
MTEIEFFSIARATTDKVDHLTKSSSGWWLTPIVSQIDDFERDALEILRLIQSLRNRLAPISRIPPEVLTLIPDFWYTASCDRDLIALSHVCRAWREMFVSRSSLWSNLDCVHADKTRVYLERSGSSPINLQLRIGVGPSSLDLLLRIIPQAIGRLKFLSIEARPENLEAIMAHFSHPAPLLEELEIDGECHYLPQYNPVLPPTIFNGDLSSLRTLHLECIRTELLWRNMVNLTSLSLYHTSAGDFGRLLDLFEGAPRLCEIALFLAALIFGGENGRLVSLDHLKRMDIIECGPTSILLNHLTIPVGAKLTTQPDSHNLIIEDHIPRSLDNLKNLSGFTKIDLYLHGFRPYVRLSGPNGQLCMVAGKVDPTSLVFESLVRFDTSRIERLRIDSISPLSRDPPYRALLPMKNLRTLVLSRCNGLCAFMDALNPNASPSEDVVCPSLEELILIFHIGEEGVEEDVEEEFDIQTVIEMAAARASRGAKLRTVKDQAELDSMDVLELRKHVLHVEYGPEVDVYDDGSDCSDEED